MVCAHPRPPRLPRPYEVASVRGRNNEDPPIQNNVRRELHRKKTADTQNFVPVKPVDTFWQADTKTRIHTRTHARVHTHLYDCLHINEFSHVIPASNTVKTKNTIHFLK